MWCRLGGNKVLLRQALPSGDDKAPAAPQTGQMIRAVGAPDSGVQTSATMLRAHGLLGFFDASVKHFSLPCCYK